MTKTAIILEKAKRLNKRFSWKDVMPDATPNERLLLECMVRNGHLEKVSRGTAGCLGEPAKYIIREPYGI